MSRLLPVAALLALFGTGCRPPEPGDTGDGASTADRPAPAYPHLLLGNPSQATEDPKEKDNFLLQKAYFALSYNSSKGTPNWVSWRVTKDDLGDAPRKLQFDPDAELPRGFRHIVHKDYSGSGFDRGHLCPHSDRAATQEESYATFVMSNVVPQAPKLNQKASAGGDGTVIVWDAVTGRIVTRYPLECSAAAVAWDPTGSDRLVVGQANGWVRQYQFHPPRPVSRVRKKSV